MEPESIARIFWDAAQITSPAERDAHLRSACGDDDELRQRVEQLLQARSKAEKLFESPLPAELDGLHGRGEAEDAASCLDLLAPSHRPDSLGRLGHFEVLEVIGHGGMGVVLRALDEKLHRVVAIKVMASQLATNAAARKRFTREARAAAAVSHDHIVTIHAVDEANGLPYLVMHYVSGVSLQQRLDRDGPLEPAEVVRISMQTANGLAAAHAQGLIHRDIKPANILLENGVERVKITDFGLARAADDVGITRTGEVTGTPHYMSPEQAQGQAVDARSDLFSLGCVMYAMCTGRSPFRAETTVAALRRVCDDAPRPIREINPDVPGWLVTVIDRLLEKAPDDRFQTASEVAETLGRHLVLLQHPPRSGLPAALPEDEAAAPLEEQGLQAPPDRTARTGSARGLRGWLVAVAALLIVLGLLAASEATGVTQMAATVIRIAMGEGTLVVEVEDPSVQVTIEGAGGLRITGAGVQQVRLQPGRYQVHALKDGHPVKLDHELVTISRGDKQVVRVSLEHDRTNLNAKPKSQGDARRLEAGNVVQLMLEKKLSGHTSQIKAVTFLPDGKRAISAAEGSDRSLRLWDLETGTGARMCVHEAPVQSMAVLAGGEQVATGDKEGRITLWEVDTGRQAFSRSPHSGIVDVIATTPDGARIVSAGFDGSLCVLDANGGEVVRQVPIGNQASALVISPDGEQAIVGQQGRLSRWELATGKLLGTIPVQEERVYSLAFSPDGSRLAMGLSSGRIMIFDTAQWTVIGDLAAHTDRVSGLAWMPNGRTLLSGGMDRTLRAWDPATGNELGRIDQPTHCTNYIAVSPTGGALLSGGGDSFPGGEWTPDSDNVLRLWRLSEGGQEVVNVRLTRASPQNTPSQVVGRAASSELQLVRTLEGNDHTANFVAVSPDSRYVLSGGRTTLKLWDLASGKLLQDSGRSVWSVGFAPDGRTIITAEKGDGGVWIWDVVDNKQIKQLLNIKCFAAAFSPDGRRAACCCEDSTVRVLDVETGREQWKFEASIVGTGGPPFVEFSADGQTVVAARQSSPPPAELFVFDVATGRQRRIEAATDKPATNFSLSPDGRFALVSVYGQPCLRKCDLEAGEVVGSFGKHSGKDCYCVKFLTDGRHAVSGAKDGIIRVWDTVTGAEVARSPVHPFEVHRLAVTPDGKQVLSAIGWGSEEPEHPLGREDLALRLWQLPEGAWQDASASAATAREEVRYGPWVSLFNGKDLSGWEAATPTNEWQVRDGILVSGGPPGCLFSQHSDYKDFHLKAEARINSGGNSGILIRTALKPGILFEGYEAQICADVDGQPKTGSIYKGTPLQAVVKLDQSPVAADAWFTLEIIAQGPRIVVKVNDVMTAEYAYPDHADRSGRIALQHHDGRSRAEFRKIEIREPDPAASAQKPFILLDGPGVAERNFATLAEALLAAGDGDTIEIRGNGPFVSGPIAIGDKALVIRAAAGFHPVVKFDRNENEIVEAMLDSSDTLVLEGWELHWISEEPGQVRASLVRSTGNLFVANCCFRAACLSKPHHFITGPVRERCEVRNCLFVHSAGSSVDPGKNGYGTAVVDNCLHVGAVMVTLGVSNHQLNQNTVVSKGHALHTGGKLTDELLMKELPVRQVVVEATGNVFDVDTVWLFHDGSIDAKPLEAGRAESFLPRGYGWTGVENLYHTRSQYSAWMNAAAVGDKLWTGPRDLTGWKELWGTPEAGSLEGAVRFDGGDLLSRLDTGPEEITPEDFRLRPDSAGYRAGADGQDLGADVDLVGPGDAYERWKKTLQYQRWLDVTRQRRELAAVTPEPGAFVVLGDKGIVVQKCDALSEAVSRAQSGDTIEIRGNGPFVTDPIDVGSKALVIRAGAGFAPHIKRSAAAVEDSGIANVLTTRAALVLEGLHFDCRMSPDVACEVVNSVSAPLFVTHCKLIGDGKRLRSRCVVGSNSPRGLLCNSVFVAPRGAAISWWGDSTMEWRVENCLIAAWTSFAVDLSAEKAPARKLQLTRNTLAGTEGFLFVFRHDLARRLLANEPVSLVPAMLESNDSVWQVDRPFIVFSPDPQDEWLTLDELRPVLPKLIHWRERQNVHGQGDQPFLRQTGTAMLGNLDEWNDFWGLGGTGSVQGAVHFQGNPQSLLAERPETIIRDDFRLAADSAGYRAGPEGKDLGADVDLVGPGEPYERWKQTPEYQTWLVDTEQTIHGASDQAVENRSTQSAQD